MIDKYILVGHEAVLEPDLIKWATWYEEADRSVNYDELAPGVGMSTVFLGMNHNMGSWRQNPILFETCLFRQIVPDSFPTPEVLGRYSTWEEAEAGHARFLKIYRRVCPWCCHFRDRKWTCQQCGKAFVPFRKYQYLPLPGGTRVWVRP